MTCPYLLKTVGYTRRPMCLTTPIFWYTTHYEIGSILAKFASMKVAFPWKLVTFRAVIMCTIMAQSVVQYDESALTIQVSLYVVCR